MYLRESLIEVFVHLIWATWDRLPLLTTEIEAEVYSCIRKECEDLNVEVLAIGGTKNHMHLLVRIPSTIQIATLVKQAKGSSCHLVNKVLDKQRGFKWQGAYAAYSVSRAMVPRVREYINLQKEHHRERNK